MTGFRRTFAVVLVASALLVGACGRGQSPIVADPDEVAAAAAATSTSVEPPSTTSSEPSTTSTEVPTTSTEPPTSAPPPTVAAQAVPPVAAPPVAPAPVPAQTPTRPVAGSIEPYLGLGTWVDVYDWSHYKGSTPTVGPDQVDQMAAAGVQTLFIQTTKHDAPGPGDILEPDLLLPIIERAHRHGIEVVAWYLPTLEDPGNDLRKLVASANLDVDGIAVDIEARNVRDVNDRNRRLIDFSSAARELLPDRAISGIVLPPVLLEVVNPNYWPGFPWREIAPYYDVWQTMGYWTDRTWASGHREAYSYTSENLRRLRANLGLPDALVHPVGGIGDETNDTDLDGFLRAAVEHRSIGGSIYDWRTTKPEAWGKLRGFRSSERTP